MKNSFFIAYKTGSKEGLFIGINMTVWTFTGPLKHAIRYPTVNKLNMVMKFNG